MTKASQQSEGFFIKLLASLLAGIVLVVPFSMRAIFWPVQGPVCRALHLEEHSLHLATWKWLLIPLKWLAGAGFVYGTAQALFLFAGNPSLPEREFLHGALYFVLALLAAGSFNVVHWLEQFHHTPAIQKKLTGLQAEQFVSQFINARLGSYVDAKALHGVLFVFNKGLPNEFSVEVDHLVLTARHVFVIETKYKSGVISANTTAAHWDVTTVHGRSTMRNALKQAKSAAQILARECHLSCIPIPLVAIQGKDVAITDAPTNVVRAEEILNVMDAFESSQAKPLFSSEQILKTLSRHIATDRESLQRHIARAEQAQSRAAMASIVESASIN